MNGKRTSALAVLAIIGMGAACSVGELDYEGKECPCPKSYRCDKETNRCTRHASGKGGASGDGSGGSALGGSSGESGEGSGGSAVGGSSGGSSSGGAGKGGTGVGGGKGGSATGGIATGGIATGGIATGGIATGGSAGTGIPVICSGANTCAQLPNDGLNLVAVEWTGAPIIACSENCIGFSADISTQTDGDVDISFDVSSGNICVSGLVHLDSNIDIYVGGVPWDAATHGIRGFEFTIEGSNVPATLEYGYHFYAQPAPSRCAVLDPASGHHSVPIDGLRLECLTGVDLGPTALTNLLRINFYLAATDAEKSFDFCITGLAATR